MKHLGNVKQNQTERFYDNVNGFELRTGKFYNPNEGIQGTPAKFEIRILHENPEIITILNEKIKELIRDV